jgi:hypothetical protein
LLDALRKLAGEGRRGFHGSANHDPAKLQAIDDRYQLVGGSLSVPLNVLLVITIHLSLRPDVIRTSRRVFVGHIGHDLFQLFYPAGVDDKYPRAMFVNQHHAEAVVLLDHFEQGPEPGLRRPSRFGRKLDLQFVLPPEILFRIAEQNQSFSLRDVAVQETPDVLAFDFKPLLADAIRALVFGDLPKQAFDSCCEPAIEIRGVRLVDVQIETQN